MDIKSKPACKNKVTQGNPFEAGFGVLLRYEGVFPKLLYKTQQNFIYST